MKITRFFPLAAALLLALLTLAPPRLTLWRYHRENLTSFPLQSMTPIQPLMQSDLDADGRMETLTLENSRAALRSATGVSLWQTPVDWEVRQAQIADLNRDGQPEAALLIWRPFAPWPIDAWLPYPGRINDFHDSAGRACHLILIGHTRFGWGELWAGSALSEPFTSFAPADLDGDGRQELAALQGLYDDPPARPARALTVWEWNGFGFTLLARHPARFTSLQVVQTAAGVRILTAQ